MTSPFLAAVFLLGCTAAVLPADGAAAGFEEATFAVAVVETFVVAAAGLDKVDAGRDVEELAAGLKVNKFRFRTDNTFSFLMKTPAV